MNRPEALATTRQPSGLAYLLAQAAHLTPATLGLQLVELQPAS